MANTQFIKDAIHGVIKIDEPWVVELINSSELKRLKHIHQLGISYVNFPNATHTRFAHSLGTYELAKSFADQINLNSKTLRNELLAAALLHDIGHGPFSHFFETITKINHEQTTHQIILDSSTQINKILKKYSIDPLNVVKILKHKHKCSILNELISGQIDADRMDYLSRDAHFAGACYGLIDSPLLIHWMYPHKNKVCFDIKAVSSLENFLISRYHMFVDVYEKPKIIVLEKLIKRLFKRFKFLYQKHKVVDCYKCSQFFLPWLKNKKWTTKEFLAIDDNAFYLFFKQMAFENDTYLNKVYQMIIGFKNSHYSVYEANSTMGKKYFNQFKKNRKVYEFTIYPVYVHNVKIYERDQHPIYIYDPNTKRVCRLHECSTIINKLGKQRFGSRVVIVRHPKVK